MPSKTYASFLASSADFSLARYGRSHALGIRGTKDQIALATNLFANFDRTSAVHHLSSDLAYISTTPQRVRAAVKLYLHVNLLHSREVGSYETWDEETGEYAYCPDEKAADAIASNDADLFMSHIRLRFPFIPTETVVRRRSDINA